MPTIEFEDGAICVDATIIGKGLGIDLLLVQSHMRDGKITSLCERGADEDIGRYRLTFFFENRRFRLVIDEEGKVIQSSTVDFGDSKLPTSMRKPGASQ